MLNLRQESASVAAIGDRAAPATMSATMQAVMLDEYGPAQTLRLAELPLPEPGPGEVRVRVRAAGVQPADCSLRNGWFARRGIGMARFPRQLGNEFAGIVDSVGAGVHGIAPDDEVLGWCAGSAYAEAVVVPATQVVAKPPMMSWAVAGALAATGQAAHTAVQTLALAAGDTAVVHHAASGVGSIAVQLVRERGARVLATAGAEHHEYLRSLGAEPLLPGPGLAERLRALAPRGVQAVLDASGKGALDAAIALGVECRRIVALVAHEDVQRTGLHDRRNRERLMELLTLHEAGRLRIHVRDMYSLAQAAAAHRDVEDGRGRGAVVLMVYRPFLAPMP